MIKSRLSTKGQLVIPARLREARPFLVAAQSAPIITTESVTALLAELPKSSTR
jgi:bifunctional DNA-binding transcriptional regulator/antitoxin component of YhaV-PrlF toxin-antitoxin module